MTRLYCQDWLNNKYIFVTTKRKFEEFKTWDKLVYQLPDNDKQAVAIFLWFEDKWEFLTRWWELLDKLIPEDLEYFNKMNEKAKEKFEIFKKDFKKEFPEAVPVTARYNIFWDQYYFYFYADQRFNFSDFVKRFRSKLKSNFFLFQIWARDMIKMSPQTDCFIWCWTEKLCCKYHRPLPSIDVETLMAQHLEWRDIERLKWRCGKLKCCLIYEAELYFEENKKFPPVGTCFGSEWCENCYVSSFNIINWKIHLKDDEWNSFIVDLDELKKEWKKLKNKTCENISQEIQANKEILQQIVDEQDEWDL